MDCPGSDKVNCLARSFMVKQLQYVVEFTETAEVVARRCSVKKVSLRPATLLKK